MFHVSSANLHGLLKWAIIVASGCILFYVGIGLAFSDTGMILSGVVIGLYTLLLLLARLFVGQGQIARATLSVSIGLVLAAILLTAAQPSLWINYSVVPMLAAAVLLQYAPNLQIYRALIACGSATAIIALLGETLSHDTSLPALLISLLRGSSLIITVAFILYLLWQFRNRLQETLISVQQVNGELETRNTALEVTNNQLQQQMQLSQELVEQVTALETPVTTLAHAVLYVPIFGHITKSRASKLRGKLLSAIHGERSRWVIVDIQGVPQIDQRVAHELVAMFQAINLLGCQVCICGISVSVAQVMTGLALSFGNVTIARDPQEALARIVQPH